MAKLRPRRIGEGVMQRMKIAIQPDKGTGVRSYWYINGKLRRYIPFRSSLTYLTVSPVKAAEGSTSFPNSSLALQSRVVASIVAIANHSIASAKCCPGQILRCTFRLCRHQSGKFALTCGRIRKRSIADSACLGSPTAPEQISQETESEWGLER